MQKPTIGRIVQYTITTDDAERINKRRADSAAHRNPEPGVTRAGTGEQHHVGNTAIAGQVFPLLITRVWNEDAGLVNGQAFLDGNDVLWVASVGPGEGERTYAWPVVSR